MRRSAQTIYYFTGRPIYINGKRVRGKRGSAAGEAKGEENLHLVTYQIPTAKYTDHGPIFLAGWRRAFALRATGVAPRFSAAGFHGSAVRRGQWWPMA